MRRAAVVLFLFCLIPAPTRAQVTLQTYRGYPEAQRTAFVMGFVGGIETGAVQIAIKLGPLPSRPMSMFNTAWGGSTDGMEILVCTEGWTFSQVRAVFDKYVTEHPEVWHEDVGVHLLRAVAEACAR